MCEKPKPCRACDSLNVRGFWELEDESDDESVEYTFQCDACGHYDPPGDSPEEGLEIHNYRPLEDRLRAEIAGLRSRSVAWLDVSELPDTAHLLARFALPESLKHIAAFYDGHSHVLLIYNPPPKATYTGDAT